MSGLINITGASFVGDCVEDAAPAGGVLHPPYEARPANDKNPAGWWFVSKNEFNVLTFISKRGAVVTNKDIALAIVKKWNAMPQGTKFDIPPDPYVAPVTTRWTDEQMAEYIRNRRYNFETKRWG
jgi:hypothetical protein